MVMRPPHQSLVPRMPVQGSARARTPGRQIVRSGTPGAAPSRPAPSVASVPNSARGKEEKVKVSTRVAALEAQVPQISADVESRIAQYDKHLKMLKKSFKEFSSVVSKDMEGVRGLNHSGIETLRNDVEARILLLENRCRHIPAEDELQALAQGDDLMDKITGIFAKSDDKSTTETKSKEQKTEPEEKAVITMDMYIHQQDQLERLEKMMLEVQKNPPTIIQQSEPRFSRASSVGIDEEEIVLLQTRVKELEKHLLGSRETHSILVQTNNDLRERLAKVEHESSIRWEAMTNVNKELQTDVAALKQDPQEFRDAVRAQKSMNTELQTEMHKIRIQQNLDTGRIDKLEDQIKKNRASPSPTKSPAGDEDVRQLKSALHVLDKDLTSMKSTLQETVERMQCTDAEFRSYLSRNAEGEADLKMEKYFDRLQTQVSRMYTHFQTRIDQVENNIEFGSNIRASTHDLRFSKMSEFSTGIAPRPSPSPDFDDADLMPNPPPPLPEEPLTLEPVSLA